MRTRKNNTTTAVQLCTWWHQLISSSLVPFFKCKPKQYSTMQQYSSMFNVHIQLAGSAPRSQFGLFHFVSFLLADSFLSSLLLHHQLAELQMAFNEDGRSSRTLNPTFLPFAICLCLVPLFCCQQEYTIQTMFW